MNAIGVCAGFLVCAASAFGDERHNASQTQRRIAKEIEVDAPRSFVWTLWTTRDGVTRFGPQKADIELKPGGKWEWYFKADAPEGSRGSEGCTVLSFMPQEMLAFNWNAPPSIPELRSANARTQVVVRFDELSPAKTRVRLLQHGFGDSAAWDEYVKYFERAWPNVLASLKEYCESADGRTAIAAQKSESAAEAKSWTDKNVTVTAAYGANKRQDFEMAIPAPTAEVWSAIATTEGFRKYVGAPNAEIDLKPGGRYSIWPEAPNKVLAFVPSEMLSVSGSAPPQFPNVRKGGTWSAYALTPDGGHGTKLRLSVIGWRDGEKEWDDAFEYFLKNNPIFLNALHEKLAKWAQVTSETLSPVLGGEGRVRGQAAFVEKPSHPEPSRIGEPLRHETLVAAPVEDVWKAFTTKEGLESWMVGQASIDLRVGGKMLTKYSKEGTLGDDGTIENTILSFEPRRMLSIKATKPPKGFPFPEAIKDMWSVLYFEPAEGGKTKVKCVGMGYGGDEESQKLRKFFDQGNAWTLEALRKHFAGESADAR